MARILLSPPSSPAIGSNSYSTGKTFCLPTVRSRRFLLAAVALIIGLPLCSSWFNFNNPHESYLDRVSHASQAQMARVWQQIGTAEHDLGFDKTCEKTLLWVFSGKSGFGSEYGMFLRAATFAKANNYTILTTSNRWDYGDFEDYFEKPPLDCAPPSGSDDFNNRDLVTVGADNWQDAPNLIAKRHPNSYHAIDAWVRENLIDLEAMKALHPLNLDVPLPYGETIPKGLIQAITLEHQVMHLLWRPKTRLHDMVENLKYQLGLHEDAQRGHVIGVHYRGGDKLKKECPWPVCGNATALLQSALDMIPNLPKPTCAECKPRIALMTIEPDALDLFNDSPLAQHFDIQPLPPPPGGLRGHNQKDFNAGSEQDILDDTFTMLRDITVMSLYADAFVVSANSNVGVIALILGGPDAQISSVDFRFKATSRPLSEYFTGELMPGSAGYKQQEAEKLTNKNKHKMGHGA